MPYIGKKVQVGFRFSPEADARLKELAEGSGLTRTVVLERLILADISLIRSAGVDWGYGVSPRPPPDFHALPDPSEGEKLVERVLQQSGGEVLPPTSAPKARVAPVKRRTAVPKPGWKK